MKLIIPRIDLVSLIGKVQGVVSAKPTIPILANILIEARDDQLIISATDLTVSMQAYAEAKVVEEGAIALPARRFFQLIREVTAPQVEIHATSSEMAHVNAGNSHFRINGMHKNEFPSLPNLSEANEAVISCTLFKEMLSRSGFAASRDDSREVLNGILFKTVENTGVFIGTDGKRLAKLETEVPLLPSQDSSYILPIKAVEEMISILSTKEDSGKLYVMEDKIALVVGPITLITKLITGRYPDVTKVIPKNRENPISLHREELISLLKQISLFTSEMNSSVRFTFDENELNLCAATGEVGEGKVSMPVNYSGPKLEIAFNPHYFLDILRHTKDETVNFSASDSYNPGLISDSTNAIFALMPMRLD